MLKKLLYVCVILLLCQNAFTQSAGKDNVLFKYPFDVAEVEKTIYKETKENKILPKTQQNINKAFIADALKKSVVIIFADIYTQSDAAPHDITSTGFKWAGTGFVVNVPTKENPAGELMIMTNSHVPNNPLTKVLIKHLETEKESYGEIYAIGFYELNEDLALIKLQDSSFYQGLAPLRVAQTAPLFGESVFSLGFPSSHTNFTFVEGSVNSFNGEYMHVSAVVNPGASGSPIVNNNLELTGVFNVYLDGNNMNMAVPLFIIKRFLAQVAEGNRQPAPGTIGLRTMIEPSNATLQGRFFSLSGIMPDYVPEGSSLDCGIDTSCLIIAIDNKKIKSNGTLKQGDIYFTLYNYVSQKKPGDPIEFTYYNPADSTIRKNSSTIKEIKNINNLKHPGTVNNYLRYAGLLIVEKTSMDLEWREVESYLQVTNIFPNETTTFLPAEIKGSAIFSVNGSRVKTIQEFKDALNPAQDTADVLTFTIGDIKIPKRK